MEKAEVLFRRAIALDSKGNLYVFQRKDPAVQVFDPEGRWLRSWGTGAFKRPHGLRIVNDVIYMTDQLDNVALIYTLEGKLLKEIGNRGQPSDTV